MTLCAGAGAGVALDWAEIEVATNKRAAAGKRSRKVIFLIDILFCERADVVARVLPVDSRSGAGICGYCYKDDSTRILFNLGRESGLGASRWS